MGVPIQDPDGSDMITANNGIWASPYGHLSPISYAVDPICNIWDSDRTHLKIKAISNLPKCDMVPILAPF